MSEQRLRPFSIAQYGILALGLALMLTLSFCALNDEGVYFYHCRYAYLPSVETTYGFTVGSLRAGNNLSVPGLVHVVPSGVLGQAGFRSGDIPISHHGGFTEFCAAVQESARGRDSVEVVVLNAAEWQGGKRRTLRIPAGPAVK